MDTDIKIIQKALTDFRDARDWAQFHDVKNLAIALSIEAGELNEVFLWKNPPESEEIDLSKVQDELADVFAYAFLIAEKLDLDVKDIIMKKIEVNGKNYPVAMSKGNSTKYTQLKDDNLQSDES